VIAVVVNAALLEIKLNADKHSETKGIRVPLAVPITGLIISFGFAIMIAIDLSK
jgi:APA family basic amino acid/polyamine antiporter